VDNGTPSLAPELAAPPASPDVSDTDLDNLDLTGLQTGNDDGEADELDPFEYEGKQYQVPRALKSKLDQLQHMDTDYTRKSQTNSARAKELDERAQRLDEQAKATEEELDTRATLRNVKSQLERLRQADGRAVGADAPDRLRQVDRASVPPASPEGRRTRTDGKDFRA